MYECNIVSISIHGVYTLCIEWVSAICICCDRHVGLCVNVYVCVFTCLFMLVLYFSAALLKSYRVIDQNSSHK